MHSVATPPAVNLSFVVFVGRPFAARPPRVVDASVAEEALRERK
jgi:hypothetical protein